MKYLKTITARHILIAIIAVSAFSLASVFISQYLFGLHPCDLCIYQRWPFGINIALGIIGLLSARLALPMISLATISFFVNAGIAIFHSGVERKWWAGLEGCSTPDMSGSIEDLMARIQSTAVTRCDEIAWVDPIVGLSMANYNVVFCLILAGLAFTSACRAKRQAV